MTEGGTSAGGTDVVQAASPHTGSHTAAESGVLWLCMDNTESWWNAKTCSLIVDAQGTESQVRRGRKTVVNMVENQKAQVKFEDGAKGDDAKANGADAKDAKADAKKETNGK